ncbi:MAG: hypothetical protein LC121_18285 [Anaerolineae bacterium]|nr:hypothetical protein [Anaerolineae bacterium]
MNQVYVGGEEEAPADEPEPTFIEEAEGIATSFADATLLTAQEIVNIVPRTINLIPGINLPEANLLGAAAEKRTRRRSARC